MEMDTISNSSDGEDDDDVTMDDTEPKKLESDIYQKYNFNYRPPELPIVASRQKICKTIRTNSVVVLQGSTGCGKTTQVPQFILDDAYKNGEYCNIVVTQPRRIAAMSIATRVASERKWEIGSVVGYQVHIYYWLNLILLFF